MPVAPGALVMFVALNFYLIFLVRKEIQRSIDGIIVQTGIDIEPYYLAFREEYQPATWVVVVGMGL